MTEPQFVYSTNTLEMPCVVTDCLYKTPKAVDVERAERTLNKPLVEAHMETLDILINLCINVLNMDLDRLMGSAQHTMSQGSLLNMCAGWWSPISVTLSKYRYCVGSRMRRRRVFSPLCP